MILPTLDSDNNYTPLYFPGQQLLSISHQSPYSNSSRQIYNRHIYLSNVKIPGHLPASYSPSPVHPSRLKNSSRSHHPPNRFYHYPFRQLFPSGYSRLPALNPHAQHPFPNRSRQPRVFFSSFSLLGNHTLYLLPPRTPHLYQKNSYTNPNQTVSFLLVRSASLTGPLQH